MKKELLIFGSNGALGNGVSNVLLDKNYDRIYLFDFHPSESPTSKNVFPIKINDLSIEENVIKAFTVPEPSIDTAFFLFSTIGGFAGGKSVWDTDIKEWTEMFNKNLTTSFLIAKYFSRLVKESHSGSICFTSAYVGLNPEKQKSAYGASKSALIHLVETLASEGNNIKLSANAIVPYIINTKPNREWMKDGDYSTWIKPKEIGELVHNIFKNYNFFTGNVLKLKDRFSLD